jgi:hypothetical protein
MRSYTLPHEKLPEDKGRLSDGFAYGKIPANISKESVAIFSTDGFLTLGTPKTYLGKLFSAYDTNYLLPIYGYNNGVLKAKHSQEILTIFDIDSAALQQKIDALLKDDEEIENGTR